jgi:AsmA protein
VKNFLKVLAGFVVLLIIAGILLISRVNTDANKTAISDAVLATTGYELVIGGDLSLSLYPNLGLSLADVRLKNPAYPMELASTSSAVLSVDFSSLISSQIQVREISTEDFHANYYIDEEGNSIWSVNADSAAISDPGTDSSSASPASSSSIPDAQGASDITTLSVERLRIANASIDIQDLSRGARYQIDNLTLDSLDTNIDGRTFSIDLQFDYENNGMSAPVPLALRSDVMADINAGTLQLTDLQLSVTPMLVSGDVIINDLNSSPSYEGSLSAAPFDVLVLLESLGMRKGQQDLNFGVDTDKLLSFDMRFNGTDEQANIPAFNIEFAGANIESDAQIRLASDLAPLNVSYTVSADALDLSPFFPESSGDEEPAPAAAPDSSETSPQLNEAAQYQPETELPVDLINS